MTMAGPLNSLALFAAGTLVGLLIGGHRNNHGPRAALERHLRRALQRNEFIVEYQPVVQLATGTCFGVEALVRWRTHNGALVPPDVFMPVSLETGLIEPLSYRIIELIAQDLLPLLRERPGFHVGVNIPPHLLGHGGLAITAERTGLLSHSEQIVIEITETSIVDEASRQAITLARRILKARVAIDDFGTGNNELAQLQDLEIDFIKVDKSFVRRIGQHEQATKFVEWIVGLTHDIGAQAIAEGIETENQAEHLRALGVEMAQGYLYAPSLSVADLRTYLAVHG
jgi:sensor c-di-GMP phosphodiesterase-like protein